MLQKIDTWIGHHMAVVAPSCLVLGLLLAPWIRGGRFLTPYLFAFMTFQSSLGNGFREVGHVFTHPRGILGALIMLHVILPLIAFGVGLLCFGTQPEIVKGMVLEFSVPTGIVTLIWASLTGGNTAFTLSLIFIDTLLSPIIVPFTLSVLMGASGAVSAADVRTMAIDLTGMVALPSLLAVMLNQFTHGRVKTTLMPRLSPITKLGFVYIITMNSTGLYEYVIGASWKAVVAVVLVMGLLVIAGFVLGAVGGCLLRVDKATAASLVFGVGMRNISAGATIAVTDFAGQAVVLPVIITTLFQQTFAALVGTGLVRRLHLGHSADERTVS